MYTSQKIKRNCNQRITQQDKSKKCAVALMEALGWTDGGAFMPSLIFFCSFSFIKERKEKANI